MKTLLLVLLFAPFVFVPAFAMPGFQPIYQPSLPASGSPIQLYCTLGEFLNSYNSTTNAFTCAATSGSGGENNTASNLGTGLGWYKQKVGVDLQFNSAIAGQGIDITDTTNDLTISTDFKIDTLPLLSLDQFVSSFDNSTGDWTTKTFSINTTDCGSNFVQTVDNSTGYVTCATGGSGEVNTYSSSGHGAGTIILTKSGVDLPFRGIASGSGVTVTQNSTDVIISATGGVSDGDKGDITVTASGATWTIDNNVVSYAKMQDVSASRFLGRITAGAGDTEELTGTQATTLLDTFTSALKGLVPASGGGTSNFLRADGTWAAPSGGSTPRGGYLMAHWTLSSTKTNIGTAFVNVYTQTNANGKAIFMDTDIFTQVRLQVQWNKIGTGTQTCQVLNGATALVSTDVVSGSNDSGWDAIPAGLLNAENSFRLQCKSTTAADDPIFESASVWMK